MFQIDESVLPKKNNDNTSVQQQGFIKSQMSPTRRRLLDNDAPHQQLQTVQESLQKQEPDALSPRKYPISALSKSQGRFPVHRKPLPQIPMLRPDRHRNTSPRLPTARTNQAEKRNDTVMSNGGTSTPQNNKFLSTTPKAEGLDNKQYQQKSGLYSPKFPRKPLPRPANAKHLTRSFSEAVITRPQLRTRTLLHEM